MFDTMNAPYAAYLRAAKYLEMTHGHTCADCRANDCSVSELRGDAKAVVRSWNIGVAVSSRSVRQFLVK